MVKRGGANIGDDIWVSGTIGDAYIGLKLALGDEHPTRDAVSNTFWLEAYHKPEPRLALIDTLREYASASLDVSDGLIADISHMAKASNCGARIKIDDIPLSQHTQKWLNQQADSYGTLKTLMTAGDDYEVVFSAAKSSRDFINQAAKELNIRLTKIGKITDVKNNVQVIGRNGETVSFTKTGYNHFSKR